MILACQLYPTFCRPGFVLTSAYMFVQCNKSHRVAEDMFYHTVKHSAITSNSWTCVT